MKQVLSHNQKETAFFAAKLGRKLRGGEVIALFGGLGMGKTVFVSGIADGMGQNAEISSPTFALVHEHPGKIPLFHFDMYRVETYYDLCSTGFFEYLDAGGVLCVEWSENIESALPENALYVTIERGDADDERIITMSGEKRYEDSWD